MLDEARLRKPRLRGIWRVHDVDYEGDPQRQDKLGVLNITKKELAERLEDAEREADLRSERPGEQTIVDKRVIAWDKVHYAIGDQVQIVGFKDSPEFNGAVGEVSKFSRRSTTRSTVL